MFRIISLLMLSTFALSSGASGCHAKQKAALPTQTPNQETATNTMKVLAEGFHSSITNPFIAVVRDAETYAGLIKLDNNLPKLDAESFKSNIVLAAFLGERNTGGYSVNISREANGQIRVGEKAPGKDVMVPQMITSPFKIVSLSVSGLPSVSLSIDRRFQERMQLYRVSSGTFRISGGFAGGTEPFQLTGELQVTRLGQLITIGFALKSRGAARERTLMDYATGLVKDNRIVIGSLSHGSLLDPPSGELQVNGTFLKKNKLTLELSSARINVPESYTGAGTIEADLVAASAN